MKRILTLLIFITVFCIGSLSTAKEIEVRFTGTTMTAGNYMLGVGWSNVINKYLPGVKMAVLAKGGTTKLLRGMVAGKWDTAYIGSPHLECARKGILLFEKEKAYSKERYYDPTRALFAIVTGWCNYVVRADSGIKVITDLKGKRVHFGLPGGFGGIMTQGVLKAHGLDLQRGDYKAMYLKTSQAVDQLRDKAGLDDALVWGGLPQPLITDLSSKIPVRLVTMTKQGWERFQREFVVGPYTLLKTLTPERLREAYRGRVVNTEPVYTWTVPLMLVVRKDMDEELVYNIVKVFWEHLDEVKGVSKQLQSLTLQGALQNLSAPLHPGAVKYYKEVGAIK
ncbi:MAG: TAXI family TRAP transporter solute-binding subunit [Deltaproteobacteria bacterium]|nr:TAXI family TRAP transporter solute-binding subunit [Deltaproteobacteria bacterium]MBW2121662.1 TAXI family TRAP transporter solute-binding subunit [Deltaproteobacteria bacterium]